MNQDHSDQERSATRRVLDLLATGKINAEEAEQLLAGIRERDGAWRPAFGWAEQMVENVTGHVAAVADALTGEWTRRSPVATQASAPRQWQGDLAGTGPVDLHVEVVQAAVEVTVSSSPSRYRVTYTSSADEGSRVDPDVRIDGRRIDVRLKDVVHGIGGFGAVLFGQGPLLKLELPCGDAASPLHGEIIGQAGHVRIDAVHLADLLIHGTNGRVSVNVPSLKRLEAKTVNGSLNLEATVGEFAILETVNGKVTAKGALTSCELHSTNGRVDGRAAVPAEGGAKWSLTTANGQADLIVQDPQHWQYSVKASSANGRADIDLPGARMTREAHPFSAGARQVTADGGLENGPILTALVQARNGMAFIRAE